MSIAIDTTIDIDATSQAVWDVLIDFSAYREWNSFTIEGTPQVGTKLAVHMSPSGGRGMSFRPTVAAATPNQELRWIGKMGSARVLSGEHFFILTPNPDGTTHLTHGENYTGALVALMKSSLDKNKNPAAGYEAFNHALKQRVETGRDSEAVHRRSSR